MLQYKTLLTKPMAQEVKFTSHMFNGKFNTSYHMILEHHRVKALLLNHHQLQPISKISILSILNQQEHTVYQRMMIKITSKLLEYNK